MWWYRANRRSTKRNMGSKKHDQFVCWKKYWFTGRPRKWASVHIRQGNAELLWTSVLNFVLQQVYCSFYRGKRRLSFQAEKLALFRSIIKIRNFGSDYQDQLINFPMKGFQSRRLFLIQTKVSIKVFKSGVQSCRKDTIRTRIGVKGRDSSRESTDKCVLHILTPTKATLL